MMIDPRNDGAKHRGMPVRQARGQTSHCAGQSAEENIARDYERRGFPILHRRWRGKGGEIDLIARNDNGLIFIEVKQSRSFDTAVHQVSPRQIARLQCTAEEYLGTQPLGSLTDVRFDVALVDGRGDIRVIENAFGQI